MELGLLTVPFADRPLIDIAKWASAHGFRALEVAAWPGGAAVDRRYAGVSHIDAERLDRETAARLRDDLAALDIKISALGYYPNLLDPNVEAATAARRHLSSLFRAAQMLGVPVVNTFVGGDKTKTVDQNFESFERIFPELVHEAGDRGVTVAIENCPMIYSVDEWPAGVNIAYSPNTWRRMFETIPDENFGINFDPSHLVWQFIDLARAIRMLGSRIRHVHAKDLQIDRDGLFERGIMSAGVGWQIPRLCGLGEVDWKVFFSELYRIGYDGPVIVEHEDSAFEGSAEKVERGFRLAHNMLRRFIE